MPKLAYRPTLPRPDDQSIVDAICDAIALGEPMATAAYSAGISERTANDWLRQGLDALNQAPPDLPLAELGSHARYALAVKEAEARFVRENMAYVRGARSADAKGWLPAMTLLERRRPMDFGRRDRMDVRQESVSVTVTVHAEGLDAAERVLAQLAARHQALLPQQAGGGGTDATVIEAETSTPTD